MKVLAFVLLSVMTAQVYAEVVHHPYNDHFVETMVVTNFDFEDERAPASFESSEPFEFSALAERH